MSKSKESLSRREFNKLGAAAIAAASLGASHMASAQTPASELESEYLMELSLDVADQLDAGSTSIAPVTGGTFGGPRLSGTVRNGGADWITQVAGHTSLDVRITLDTDDGAIIYMTYTGVVHPGENGLYWRVRPIFQTASEKYDWLNHIVCVGKSKQITNKVAYDIFQIL
ncbi:MAG: hypothetical protein COA96_10490 [SAR86 cluster bacterium]|uniref:UPF0311 protein COA96_10490 n=1 Tax=SAR86 cluster bacterium TaxID=2030880 RepID=A0A2A5AY24_9GAMM|nr:MAG: hypothetical protein COA96_10490 [SAR86 cluster bacterium]